MSQKICNMKQSQSKKSDKQSPKLRKQTMASIRILGDNGRATGTPKSPTWAEIATKQMPQIETQPTLRIVQQAHFNLTGADDKGSRNGAIQRENLPIDGNRGSPYGNNLQQKANNRENPREILVINSDQEEALADVTNQVANQIERSVLTRKKSNARLKSKQGKINLRLWKMFDKIRMFKLHRRNDFRKNQDNQVLAAYFEIAKHSAGWVFAASNYFTATTTYEKYKGAPGPTDDTEELSKTRPFRLPIENLNEFLRIECVVDLIVKLIRAKESGEETILIQPQYLSIVRCLNNLVNVYGKRILLLLLTCISGTTDSEITKSTRDYDKIILGSMNGPIPALIEWKYPPRDIPQDKRQQAIDKKILRVFGEDEYLTQEEKRFFVRMGWHRTDHSFKVRNAKDLTSEEISLKIQELSDCKGEKNLIVLNLRILIEFDKMLASMNEITRGLQIRDIFLPLIFQWTSQRIELVKLLTRLVRAEKSPRRFRKN